MDEQAWPHRYLPTNINGKFCGNAIKSKPIACLGSKIENEKLVSFMLTSKYEDTRAYLVFEIQC